MRGRAKPKRVVRRFELRGGRAVFAFHFDRLAVANTLAKG
jgi:hypothetical protein